MITLYILDAPVRFSDRPSGDTVGSVLHWNLSEELSFTKLLEKVQFTKPLEVISSRPEQLFEQLCQSICLIEAGGGWIVNESAEVLMIRRNGCWDLPKGKREGDETLEQCALREVMEECGVAGIRSRGWLCDTYHSYELKGKWVIKRTAWFGMELEKKSPLTPQQAEGITHVEWVGSDLLRERVESSYGTIRDVWNSAQAND